MALKKQALNEQKLTEKILLHLKDCFDVAYSYQVEKRFAPLVEIFSFLDILNEKEFKTSVRLLNKHKLIEKKKKHDGSVIISLTEKGELRALNLKFKNLKFKKGSWDKKWRMVAFDIPNKFIKGRNALRYKLRTTGFYELQESLLLYPYDCEKEVKEFIKLFKLEKYVRFALLEYIDNQEDIKKIFKLN